MDQTSFSMIQFLNTGSKNEKSPPNYRSKGFSLVMGAIEISNFKLRQDFNQLIYFSNSIMAFHSENGFTENTQ